MAELEIEMSRQLEEMRAHQAQQTEAEEQRSRAQELRSQAMQENISRMMEMMQTLIPRPVTDPSSSNHGSTTTPTLPHPSPRPPEPVVVTGTGISAAEQHVARRAPLNPPRSNRSTDGASKIAENLNQGEPTLGTDYSDSTAHQVLDKMPRSFVSGELIFLDEIEKINEELVDGFNWEATPMSSVEELDGVKVLKESKLRNTIPTIHALKLPTEFSEKESMMNGVVCVICFDPGGNNPSHRDHATCLSNKNFENAAGRATKLVDEVFSQLKESYQAAAQGTHTSYAEHVLEVADAQGKFAFDPGGGVMFFASNLSYTEEMSEMQKSFEASLFGIIMNSSVPFASEYDQAKKIDNGLLNLVLETDMFGSVACFETFCFDPGGNYAGVLLERHIVEYELSKFVAWELVEMEPENSAHYVVLSNLYAEMGRWADVSKIRGLMKEKALMKAFEVYADKILLQPEHMTVVRFFAKNPSPQVSKGDEMLKGIFFGGQEEV